MVSTQDILKSQRYWKAEINLNNVLVQMVIITSREWGVKCRTLLRATNDTQLWTDITVDILKEYDITEMKTTRITNISDQQVCQKNSLINVHNHLLETNSVKIAFNNEDDDGSDISNYAVCI